ncbi:uncharacterized protein LOC112454126 [Temnothorax curvispinosus]|uniref:Uncharacterized protein LOC112454126 n=1 Tax=Temnothorax curvispinosus TaxID=300111 RepID=A0A6J1PN68_9HYME|nr:uncharacterized protein LOC112454126 [Temnothorax curvispinosus]
MKTIKLYDPETDNTYILEVNEEEAERANDDLVFATQLLKQRLRDQTQSIAETTCSSNSTCHDREEKMQESSDNSEEKDGFRWPHEAVLLLLEVFKERETKLTSGKMSVKKFWDMVASVLREKDYNVTGSQCKSKMTGLKNTYKSVKDHNAKSGNNKRTWRYFDIMDEQFNKKPWVAPIRTLDSNNPTIPTSNDNNSDTKKVVCESKVPSKRKNNVNIEKLLEDNMIERKRMHTEAMSRQDDLLGILRQLVAKNINTDMD